MKKLFTILSTFILLSTIVFGAMTLNEEETQRGKGDYTIYDVSVNIEKGWNLISFPGGLDFKLDGSNFKDGELKYGYLYSILDGKYIPVYKDHVYTQDRELSQDLNDYMNKYNPSSNLEWIRLSGPIFWIFSEKEGNLKYEHVFIDDFYKFHDGVNVISATPDVIHKILTSDFGDCVVEDILKINPLNNKWIDWDTDRELETGQGVVFIVEDECDLNKVDETEIKPPSIPT